MLFDVKKNVKCCSYQNLPSVTLEVVSHMCKSRRSQEQIHGFPAKTILISLKDDVT